ncbi:MAG: hypothetical protein IJW31_00450 [Lentisphaeria bacterium]|nr:hypothetical protein [Lentisphaeria bacterium]
MDNYLNDLLKLLADSNDNIARAVMVEILKKYPTQVKTIAAELQESPNEIIRRRSHQLQSFLTLRERRLLLHNFIHKHEDKELKILEALIYLHLLWFDKDSLLELKETSREFMRDFPRGSDDIFHASANFMREKKAVSIAENIADAELFLLGTVIDSHYGCSSFWCTLLLGILELYGINHIQVLKFEKSFYLFDKERQLMISPNENWQILAFDSKQGVPEKFDKFRLIKYLLSIIFANAVADDEFRYIFITGDILKSDSAKGLSFLPYPYGKKD